MSNMFANPIRCIQQTSWTADWLIQLGIGRVDPQMKFDIRYRSMKRFLQSYIATLTFFDLKPHMLRKSSSEDTLLAPGHVHALAPGEDQSRQASQRIFPPHSFCPQQHSSQPTLPPFPPFPTHPSVCHSPPPGGRCHSQLEIQLRQGQLGAVGLYEQLARLHQAPHEQVEHVAGGSRVLQREAPQAAGGRIEGRLPELLRHHLP